MLDSGTHRTQLGQTLPPLNAYVGWVRQRSHLMLRDPATLLTFSASAQKPETTIGLENTEEAASPHALLLPDRCLDTNIATYVGHAVSYACQALSVGTPAPHAP